MAKKCTTCDVDRVIAGGERGEAMESCPTCQKPKKPTPKPQTKGKGKKAATAPTPAEPKPTSRKLNSKGLTIKQEKFCQEYIKVGNASEAYRRAYDAGKMKTETINRNACALLDDNKVATRVFELRAKVADRHDITVDDLVAELEEARKLAKDTDQPSSMVSATMGKGKLLGMIVDRKEITVHSAISAMSDDELSSFIEEVDVDDDDYEIDEAADD